MKQILSTLIILLISVAVFSQNDQIICNLGFSFKISNNPNWGNSEPIVTEVTPGSPAEKAGLQEGDKIVNINGQEIDYHWEIKDIIEANLSARLDFEIIRDNRTIHAFVTPHLIDDTGVPKIGVTIDDDSDVWGFIDSDEVTCNN